MTASALISSSEPFSAESPASVETSDLFTGV
jgi:hypothetical protein